MTERRQSPIVEPADPSELEGGGDDQSWGQGQGRHEPTIPGDPAEQTSYEGGTPHRLDDPDMPLSREDEDMEK